MPPKTKPNEKCPCGSGNKYKKCCMISDAKEKSTLAAASAATTTTTVLDCYHGSDEEHFANDRGLQEMIDAWFSAYKKHGATEFDMLLQNFRTKHSSLLKDSNFYQYIFAYTTEVFRNSYKTEKYTPSLKKTLTVLLLLGIESKYSDSSLSVDREKRNKYSRDIMTERGIINCLFRETKTFCKCMEPLKLEAMKMEKLGCCQGCKQEFPKDDLKRCSRCLFAQYCSNKCMKTAWPSHKKNCGILGNCNNNNKIPTKSEE